MSEKADIPEYFHPDAKDLIEKLLIVESSKRLGCVTNQGGVEQIKTHPWFSSINWLDLTNKSIPGPLNPTISKEGDTHNFYKYSDVDINEEFDVNLDYEKIFEDF